MPKHSLIFIEYADDQNPLQNTQGCKFLAVRHEDFDEMQWALGDRPTSRQTRKTEPPKANNGLNLSLPRAAMALVLGLLCSGCGQMLRNLTTAEKTRETTQQPTSNTQVVLINQLQGQDPSFSPDGQLIATSSYRGQRPFGWVYTKEGNLILQGNGLFDFSPDSQLIGTSSNNRQGGNISWVYNQEGQERFQIKGTGIQFSPDSQLIATSSLSPQGDSTSWVYTNEGQERFQLQGIAPRFSPDGQLIATSSPSSQGDDTSWVYSKEGQERFQMQGIGPHFSPDGQLIVTTSSSDSRVSWVYTKEGQELSQMQGVDPIFGPDGQLIITFSGEDQTGWVYTKEGQERFKLKGKYVDLITDSVIVTIDSTLDQPVGHTFRIYHRDGQELVQLQREGIRPFYHVSPDDRYITTYDFRTSSAYDINTGQERFELQGVFPRFSPDGHYIATIVEETVFREEYDSEFYTYNTLVHNSDGQERFKLRGAPPIFSDDGEYIVTSEDKFDYNSWVYTKDGRELSLIQGIKPIFSPDGKRIVTESEFEDNTSWIYALEEF